MCLRQSSCHWASSAALRRDGIEASIRVPRVHGLNGLEPPKSLDETKTGRCEHERRVCHAWVDMAYKCTMQTRSFKQFFASVFVLKFLTERVFLRFVLRVLAQGARSGCALAPRHGKWQQPSPGWSAAHDLLSTTGWHHCIPKEGGFGVCTVCMLTRRDTCWHS